MMHDLEYLQYSHYKYVKNINAINEFINNLNDNIDCHYNENRTIDTCCREDEENFDTTTIFYDNDSHTHQNSSEGIKQHKDRRLQQVIGDYDTGV